MVEVDTDVVIIGAGSTGLLLAQGLKSAGITFRIFERHSATHSSREWSMSLHWGGEFLSQLLPPDLHDRLHEAHVDPGYDFSGDEGFVQCDGESGEVILVMKGVKPRRVSRRRLRGLMAEGIDIEHDKALANLTVCDPGTASSHVTATFSDNTTIKSRILIGCDGSRSQVRNLMLHDSSAAALTPTPYTILNFPHTYPAHLVPSLRQIHPVFKVSYHPKLNCMYLLSVLDTSKADESGEVTFQNLCSWKGSPTAEEIKAKPELALQRLREWSPSFAEPFRVATGNLADDTKIYADQGMQWDPRPHFSSSVSTDPSNNAKTTSWNGHSFAGTVTLAGDAAHSMLPHRGQGLNNALEDAARLTEALKKALKEGTVDLAAAVADYEEEMVARGGGEVETTARAAVAGHDWELLKQSPIFTHGANKVR